MRLVENAEVGFWVSLFTALILNVLVLGASVVLLGATGPVVVAYVASLVLILRTSGVVYSQQKYSSVARAGISRYGRLVVIHSHHDPTKRSSGHEFKIRGKYFCAGCYGLALGTSLSLVLPTLYLTGALKGETLTVALVLAPVCFVPTILRGTTSRTISALGRFVSYGLLQVGSWIVIVSSDALLHDWLLNVFVLGLIVVGWNAGGLYLLSRND
jgi:hypothetical protein